MFSSLSIDSGRFNSDDTKLHRLTHKKAYLPEQKPEAIHTGRTPHQPGTSCGIKNGKPSQTFATRHWRYGDGSDMCPRRERVSNMSPRRSAEPERCWLDYAADAFENFLFDSLPLSQIEPEMRRALRVLRFRKSGNRTRGCHVSQLGHRSLEFIFEKKKWPKENYYKVNRMRGCHIFQSILRSLEFTWKEKSPKENHYKVIASK